MEIITPRPDLKHVIQLYGSFLADYDYLMRACGANRGWIRFSPRLHELTIKFKCQNYPELYQDETRILSAILRAFFDNDETISQFLTDLSACAPTEQTVFMNEFFKDARELGQWMDENIVHLDDLDWSPSGQAKARRKHERLPIETQQKAIRTFQYSLMFSLAGFYK